MSVGWLLLKREHLLPKMKAKKEKSTAGKAKLTFKKEVEEEEEEEVTLKELDACCHYSLARLVKSLTNEKDIIADR